MPSAAGTNASTGFTSGNSYFGFKVLTWNLPSGYTCPGARECLTYADRDSGKLRHGPLQTFRCYSASVERYPAVRDKAWANFELMRNKSPAEVYSSIESLMPQKAAHVRIHAGGDFFSQDYFDGWLKVCAAHPGVRFWAFTKSLPYWLARAGQIPQNLCLQASYGGKHDADISEHGLKFARVVWSLAEAGDLPIDVDDTLAMGGAESFALLENFTNRRKRAANA